MAAATALSRRTILTGTTASIGLALARRPAAAADEEPVLLLGARGGIRGDIMQRVTVEPFAAQSKLQVKNVPYPTLAKLQAMVQTNSVNVDLITTDAKEIEILAGRGMLERIDYAQLPPNLKEDLVPGAALEYGLGELVYGQGIVYNSTRFKKGEHPRTWAEFWDVRKFPGPRTLPDGTQNIGPFEPALLADGVTPDKLYPLDLDRAFKSLDRIKPHIVKWWTSSAEGLNLLTSRNATLGMMTYGLIITTKLGGKQIPLDIEFNEGFAKIFYWIIPKGAPHPRNAHRMLAYFYDPKNYADFMNSYPAYGPTSKASIPHITAKSLETMVTAPQNAANVIMLTDLHSDAWWSAKVAGGKSNFEHMLERWNDWVSR